MRNPLFSSLYNRFSPFYMTVLFLLFACLYPSNAYAAKFSLYDKVEVYNTGGAGLKLRSWYGTSYSVKTIMTDGTQMTVYGGPYDADGKTWWYLYGYVAGIYDSSGYYYSPGYYYGYAAEDWLRKVTGGTLPGSFTLTATPGCNGTSPQIQLSWTAASNANSYDLYRDGSLYYSGLTGTQFNNTSVTAGNTYSYYVQAKNFYGSTNSNTVSATAPTYCDGSPPGSFTLTATPGCNGTSPQIQLSWTAASNANSYDLYRDGSLYYSGLTGTQFNNTSVTAGNTYSYYVQAKNSYGSTNSNTVSATAKGCVTTVTVTSPNGGDIWSADSTQTITWTVTGTTSSINYFWVAYSTDGGTTFTNIQTASASDRSLNWTIPSTISSTQCRIRVRALDASGNILAYDTSDSNFTISSGCTDSYEPNDSSIQAYGYLTSGSSYSGKICSGSDVDWFKVNITTAGPISVNLTVPSSNDYYVELYGPSYTWVAGYDNGGTGASESISYSVTTTGNYYIRVLGYNGSYNTTSLYTLTYSSSVCNYSISQTSQSFSSSGDSGSVSVTADDGCNWTATSNDTSWITVTSGSSGSGNGTVYYSVSSNTNPSSRTGTMTIAGQTFTVTQEGISCTDSYEPNDSSSTAYGPLSSGSSYSGKICSSSDVDWFKVNITTKGTISVNLTVPSSKDYDLELYDPSYAWIAGSYSSSTSESISKSITTTGNYYIRISGSNGSYSTTSSYALAYTFTPISNDITKPTGSITINSGASYTKSTTVTLTLSASDNTGVTGYYLSTSSTKPSSGNNGWVSISSTTSYSTSISYTLSSGDGSKTVYVWYKDAAGNVSDSASDSITLDTAAPIVTITSPTSNSTYTTTSSTINLGGSGSDSTSGVSSVTWSNSKGGSGTTSGTTSWSISSISLSNGDNTITVTAADNAGNSGTDTITVKYSSGTVPTPSSKATPSPTPTGTAIPTPSPTTSPEEENLLEKYAPILYMHEKERFYPTNVEVMLENSELYISDSNIPVYLKDGLTLENLIKYCNEDTYYLKLKKESKKKLKDKKRWKKDITVYGRKFTKDGKTILQYWFFYIYNDWGKKTDFANVHEGDWEMIQIILGSDKQPLLITYSYHEGGETFLWVKDKDEIDKSNDGNHPKVYVTLGGHGSWNKAGNHAWYQKLSGICLDCEDETKKGDVLYPPNFPEDEIQTNYSKYPYKLVDMSDWTENDWIYWKGYWGNQEKGRGFKGPPSPVYIDYIKDDEYEGRWKEPVKWGVTPLPGNYQVCSSNNSKITVYDLNGNIMRLLKKCSPSVFTINSEKDLVFDVCSLDGEEVNLNISRFKRTTGEVYEVEFDWLEIPKNGKATLRFSPDENPNLGMEIDHDHNGIFDYRVSPDYATQNP